MKTNYHGLPFTYLNYADVISGVSGVMKWTNSSKKNKERTKIPFFYVDAKYDFDTFAWYTG